MQEDAFILLSSGKRFRICSKKDHKDSRNGRFVILLQSLLTKYRNRRHQYKFFPFICILFQLKTNEHKEDGVITLSAPYE